MADEKDLVNQDEIEQLLQQQQASKQASPDATQQGPAQPESPSDGSLSQSDIEALLSQGGQAAAGGSSSAPQASQVADSPATGSTEQGLQQGDIDRSSSAH